MTKKGAMMVNSTIRISVDDKADAANKTNKAGTRESFCTDVPASEKLESVDSLKQSMSYKNQPDSE